MLTASDEVQMKPIGEALNFDPLTSVMILTAQVDISSIFEDGPAPKLRHDQSGMTSLGCLDGIKTSAEGFIPERIFFRQCMNKFLEKMIENCNYRRILMGAPGVGKSILTFLCFLFEAARCKRNMLYVRKTAKGGERISMFWMIPVDADNNKVDIEYTRSIPRDRPVATVFNLVLSSVYGRFHPDVAKYKGVVDGPSYATPDELLDHDLVTSGGYPTPKSEQRGNVIRTILDSWLKEETTHCLRALGLAKTKKEATEVHDLCGGQIRESIDICGKEDKINDYKKYLKALLEDVPPETFALITTTGTRNSDEKSVDRLRAMFASDDSLSRPRQVVLSTYVLRNLQARMPLEKIRTHMIEARNSKPSSLYGIYFEAFGHRLMSTLAELKSNQNPGLTLPDTIDFSVMLAEGGWKESAQQLTESSVYWEPDSDNFPNIDSAIHVSDVLHCIQYFTGQRGYHKFSIDTFLQFFLMQLPHGLPISKVVVHFVTPEDRLCKGAAIPFSQKGKFAKQIRCEENFEVKWRNTKSDDDDSSSTQVERAGETPTGAGEMTAGDSQMSEPNESAAREAMVDEPFDEAAHSPVNETLPMETEDEDESSYEQADESFSDESLGGESIDSGATQEFLPIYFRATILNTGTNPGNDVPFEFLRPPPPQEN